MAWREVAGALEAGEGVRVLDPLGDGLGRERRAFFLDPGESAHPHQLLGQPPLESEEMQHVGRGVATLGLGEGAPRPVIALPRGW